VKTLVKLEITRALRNRKFMFFSVIYPPILYLLIAGTANNKPIQGMKLSLPLYMMVTLSAFGALTSVLLNNPEKIATERYKGWVRQLRLTTLPGRGYVLAKIVSTTVVSLPSIVLVFVAAATVKGVRLEAWQWLTIGACTWIGSFAFAALGVALGYLASPDSARPLSMLCYFVLALLGGLWMPSTIFPHWLQEIGRWLPTYRYAALGRAVEVGDAPHAGDMAVLAAYLVVFTAAAAWLYRRDTRKA
jgi:ABC-2 type transport system permease protein